MTAPWQTQLISSPETSAEIEEEHLHFFIPSFPPSVRSNQTSCFKWLPCSFPHLLISSSFLSLRHERAQAVCGQRAEPVRHRPHGAPRPPLPEDRGEAGQAARHRWVAWWLRDSDLLSGVMEVNVTVQRGKKYLLLVFFAPRLLEMMIRCVRQIQ